MKVLGIKRSEGSFKDPKTNNDVNYKNYNLILTEDSVDGTVVCGSGIKLIKGKLPSISQELLNNICNQLGMRVEDLFKKEVELYFNEYGKINSLSIKG